MILSCDELVEIHFRVPYWIPMLGVRSNLQWEFHGFHDFPAKKHCMQRFCCSDTSWYNWYNHIQGSFQGSNISHLLKNCRCKTSREGDPQISSVSVTCGGRRWGDLHQSERGRGEKSSTNLQNLTSKNQVSMMVGSMSLILWEDKHTTHYWSVLLWQTCQTVWGLCLFNSDSYSVNLQRLPRGSVRITVAIFDSSTSQRVFAFSALKAMASDKVPRCPTGGADGGHEFYKGSTQWLYTVDMIVTNASSVLIFCVTSQWARVLQ